MVNPYLEGNFAPVLEERSDDHVLEVTGVVPPDLEGRLLRNGPNGGNLEDVATKKTVVASIDPVALDTYVAKAYWNLDPEHLPYLQMAANRGLGTTAFETLSVKFSQLG